MISTRTEKAIRKVQALGKAVQGIITLRANGNHSIRFCTVEGLPLATMTLNQIMGKRYQSRKNRLK